MKAIEAIDAPCLVQGGNRADDRSMIDFQPVPPVTVKEIVRCPQCQSANIVYTCEPKCCFNHICADCRSTFQLNTERAGRFDRETLLNVSAPESSEPTAECANCGSLKVAVLDSPTDELLCADCRAVSKLLIEEFVAGS